MSMGNKSAGKAPIRVLVIDDHDAVRRGLEIFIESVDDLELVGQGSNGQEAIRLCQEIKPDVVLMDLTMPVMDGITATRKIHEFAPDIRIIALTSFQNEVLLRQAVDAGFSALLSKGITAGDLAEVIRSIETGSPAPSGSLL